MGSSSEKAVLKASLDGWVTDDVTEEQDAEKIYSFLRKHIPNCVYSRLKRKMIIFDK